MEALRILGGVSLDGVVNVGGAKNAALPIMASCILANGPVYLGNVPRVTDVDTLARVLAELGIGVTRDAHGMLEIIQHLPHPNPRPAGEGVRIPSSSIARSADRFRASRRFVHRMRASFCVLGPLLARRRRAVVALPGGCRIGSRPIDLHLKGLAALGADLLVSNGYVRARANRLRGANIDLRGPQGTTVTGTANVLCAATLAKGRTVIHGAACEPEIIDLGCFLNRLGARISGLGTDCIEVRGVDQLIGGDYSIISDRIEAATLLMAGAMTRGAVTVRGANREHLAAVLELLEQMGAKIDVSNGRSNGVTTPAISIRCAHALRPIQFTARPFPGIPTDLQAHFTALASLARGRSTIGDAVFPERYRHARELNRLGAAIRIRRDDAGNAHALVTGVASLAGADVHATDLRASAALVLAGLGAHGQTTVFGLRHLDRGYDRLEQKLRQLGARIERVSIPERSETPRDIRRALGGVATELSPV